MKKFRDNFTLRKTDFVYTKYNLEKIKTPSKD